MRQGPASEVDCGYMTGMHVAEIRSDRHPEPPVRAAPGRSVVHLFPGDWLLQWRPKAYSLLLLVSGVPETSQTEPQYPDPQ